VEAVALAEQHVPAVAVLDVRMSGGGVTAACEILRRSPSTRILAFSAYQDAAAMQEMADAGAIEYLVKGIPNVEIVAAVRRAATG
jgi:DNA-binding NarL/FixJ family response regulator